MIERQINFPWITMTTDSKQIVAVEDLLAKLVYLPNFLIFHFSPYLYYFLIYYKHTYADMYIEYLPSK